MKIFSLLLFFFLWNRVYSQDIIINNINIIDVNNKQVYPNKTILISEKKIKRISSRSFKVKNAIAVNGKGKFLIPGLWDMHVHTVDSSYLKLFIINGVTGVRDMGGAATNANNGCESIEFKTLLNWRNLNQACCSDHEC